MQNRRGKPVQPDRCGDFAETVSEEHLSRFASQSSETGRYDHVKSPCRWSWEVSEAAVARPLQELANRVGRVWSRCTFLWWSQLSRVFQGHSLTYSNSDCLAGFPKNWSGTASSGVNWDLRFSISLSRRWRCFSRRSFVPVQDAFEAAWQDAEWDST